MTTINELSHLLSEQAKYERMEGEEGVNNLYENMRDDLSRMFPGWAITTDKSKAGKAINVKRGEYFQYFSLPNMEVLVTNKFF